MSGYRIPTGEHQIVRPTNGEDLRDDHPNIERREADNLQAKIMRWIGPAIVGGVLSGGGVLSYLNPVEHAKAQAEQSAKDNTQDAAIKSLAESAIATARALGSIQRNQVRACMKLRIADCEQP